MNHAPEQVVFYDGVIGKPYQATIQPIDEHSVLVKYGDQLQFEQQLKYADMTLIGALGQIQPVIEMQDDVRIEFQKPLPEWFNLATKANYHSIWKLERSLKLIIFSVFFVAGLIFSIVKWGIPAAAHYVAFKLPDETMYKIGNEAEDYIRSITRPSSIPEAKQREIIQRYQSLVADGKPAKVIFLEGGPIGANALAIPNNTIILTDELVDLAKHDDEVLGVLAHEQGHLNHKHSMQQTLSGLGFSLLILVVSGDSSDLFTSIPASLIGAKYSRDFESEADLYALNVMYKRNVDTQHFADFLARLNAKDSGDENESIGDFLQSHPATEKRIKAVKDFQNRHAH